MSVLKKLLTEKKYALALEVLEQYENTWCENDGLPDEFLLTKAFCLVCLNRTKDALTLDLSDEDLWKLALSCIGNNCCDSAEKILELLQLTDSYTDKATKHLRKIAECKKLHPGHIVTASGLSVNCEENNYKPGFSKTKDAAGTKYFIWKIDVARGLVYTLPLSEVEDKYGYRIAGTKYGKNVPDRWAKSIVRVFSIFDIENVVGELKEIDFERALSSAYNSFVFSAKCKPIASYASSFCDYMVEKRKKTVRPGFLLEYKDYSDNPAGVIRSFCVFNVDVANKIYQTFELKRNGKIRYMIDATAIFEIPMDFHFSSAYLLKDEALKRNMRNFASQFRNNSRIPVIQVVSSALKPSARSQGECKFRVAPAGDYPGINHGTRELNKNN